MGNMTFCINKYVGIGTIPGCFLHCYHTIRHLILNCVSSYVFFIRNAMFTIKFPTHDIPGNFTFIAVPLCFDFLFLLSSIHQSPIQTSRSLFPNFAALF